MAFGRKRSFSQRVKRRVRGNVLRAAGRTYKRDLFGRFARTSTSSKRQTARIIGRRVKLAGKSAPGPRGLVNLGRRERSVRRINSHMRKSGKYSSGQLKRARNLARAGYTPDPLLAGRRNNRRSSRYGGPGPMRAPRSARIARAVRGKRSRSRASLLAGGASARSFGSRRSAPLRSAVTRSVRARKAGRAVAADAMRAGAGRRASRKVGKLERRFVNGSMRMNGGMKSGARVPFGKRANQAAANAFSARRRGDPALPSWGRLQAQPRAKKRRRRG